jgi:N-acetylglucosaminyldiphosphoundecaprenol N-acetyl-beta-D-mannosaminyltransferase
MNPRMNDAVVLGVPIQIMSFSEAVEACLRVIDARDGRTRTFVHVNPHSLVAARTDPCAREALAQSDLRFADGAGLLLVGRLRGIGFPDRIAGPDLVPRLSDALERGGGARYFFLGSTDEVLRKIEARVARSWPSIRVVGTLSPPFRETTEAEEATQVATINAARPDVLWVGMTAPKQELWVARNRHRLEVPLVGSVGAAFDYLAETKTRSPLWFREHGLEWLPRLVMEPARLWRRTFLSAPLFLWYSFRESLSRRTGAPS